MKVLHVLVSVLVFVAMLAVGLGLVLAGWKGESWVDAMVTAQGLRYYALCVGFGLLLISVMYVVTAFPKRKPEPFLSYDQNGGTVSISTVAIGEYVLKLDSEFPSITKMKPHVVPTKKHLDIEVGIYVKAGPHIHEICDQLQNRVRESVIEGLGITDVRRVEVIVEKIIRTND